MLDISILFMFRNPPFNGGDWATIYRNELDRHGG